MEQEETQAYWNFYFAPVEPVILEYAHYSTLFHQSWHADFFFTF